MDYGLTRRVFGAPKFVQLELGEYEEIKRSRDLLLEVLFIEQKFDLLIDGYVEFETQLLDIGVRDMVRGARSWAEFQDQRNQLNRRVVNLLSATRLYVDHTRHHLGKIDSMVPSVKAKLEAAFSEQYDASLGYRFMEALRNYVQHRGYPIHGVNYSATRKTHGSVHVVVPYVEPAQFEEDGKFKAAVLAELKAMTEKIDIRPFVREYVSGLGQVHQIGREQMQNVAESSDQVIRKAIERYQSEPPSSESTVGLAAVARDGLTHVESVPLFEDLLDYRKSFEKKNRSLPHLTRRYVSGESEVDGAV